MVSPAPQLELTLDQKISTAAAAEMVNAESRGSAASIDPAESVKLPGWTTTPTVPAGRSALHSGGLAHPARGRSKAKGITAPDVLSAPRESAPRDFGALPSPTIARLVITALLRASEAQARACAGELARLANALQARSATETHEAGTHVRRAAEMVRRGDADAAALYLRTLAQNALRHRRALLSAQGRAAVGNQLAAELRAVRARAYWTASRLVLRLGIPSQWLTRLPAEAIEAPVLKSWELDTGRSGGKIAGYIRPAVDGPCIWFGVCVEVDQRDKGRGYWVELQCMPEDGSQFVVNRKVETREAALALGEQLAALGERVIAATIVRGAK